MITHAALLAAVGDWVTWIVVIVVVVVGFLNQLFSEAGKKRPPQMPRRPNGGGGAANPAGGQKSLLDEVEKFLQEARQATAQSHQRPPQQQQQPLPRHLQQNVSRPSSPDRAQKQQERAKRKSQQAQQRREAQQRAQAERSRLQPEVDDLEEVPSSGDLGRLSQKHLQTTRFDERAQRLSHLQQTVDTDIGGHVRNVFDHQLGSLASDSSPSTAATAGATAEASNPALQLIAMLGDPAGMRNAVLMREILEPPTHRW